MAFQDETLWQILEQKAAAEDSEQPNDQKISSSYLSGIRQICEYSIERAATIRDTFPMYTLHDETHICNVMRLMKNLLGEDIQNLSRDETAMLILSACCHDIGMSYSVEEKSDVLDDIDRLNQYLDKNHSEYVKAYANGNSEPVMTFDMIQNYLRSIHHERARELLYKIEWPSVLKGKVDRDDLIQICLSHGKDAFSLNEMEHTSSIDLRFCAILLRLADILDFDTSRTPQAVYEYIGFDHSEHAANIISKEEWDKHMVSHGFDFCHIADRSYPYELNYNAFCTSMQLEQAINCYLDWIDQELNICEKQLRRFVGKWQQFILPSKIKRNIRAEGYLSGQYRLTLDQSQVLELFVGKQLYHDNTVFVRELLQNSIDAVRTREQLDKNLPANWHPQINIRCWMDEKGYHWFRIEDNGTGMTEDIIMNYLLKIGRSYYTSDAFRQEKLRCGADPDYMPISRFGIGILSCFMDDNQTNQVEISTKRFHTNGNYNPALRLSMHGINGYYYMASHAKGHKPGPMKGVTPKEKEAFLKQPGTVIAVRMNLYQTGKYKGFKEIIDQFVCFPPVAIHYDGSEGSFDYPTEAEFKNAVHSMQSSTASKKSILFEFPLSAEQLQEIYQDCPELSFHEPPKVLLKCVPLERYTASPYLSGVFLTTQAVGEHASTTLKIAKQEINANVKIDLDTVHHGNNDKLFLHISLILERKKVDYIKKIQSNYDYICRSYHTYYDQLINYYKADDNGLIPEILYAKVLDFINDDNWIHDIAQKYEISCASLKHTIKEIENKFHEISGIPALQESDLTLLNEYRNFKHKWKFCVCDLSKLNWYNKIFAHSGIIVHNGIKCGNVSDFINNHANLFRTILLLKDKYRPTMDVARNHVYQIPLETAIDFTLMDRHFPKEIRSSVFKIESICNYSDLPAIKFWELIDKRSDWKEQLTIPTEYGKFSAEKLHQKIRKYNKAALKHVPTLEQHFRTGSENLYNYLIMAYLRKEFSLRIYFGQKKQVKYPSGKHLYEESTRDCLIHMKLKYPGEYVEAVVSHIEIYILEKEADIITGYENIFPVNTFIAPLEADCPYLTSNSSSNRFTCNASHRVSQFVLVNGEALKKQVPGIFYEILSSLANDHANELIIHINSLLTRINNLPGGLIHVPTDVYLTEKDLYP